MQTKFNLEINLSQTDDGFKATAPAFPKVEGHGKTEEEALNTLSANISEFIRNFTQETFSKVLSSNNFTEVLLDSQPENKLQQRIYRLDPELLNFRSGFTVRVKPNPEISKMVEPDKDDILSLFHQQEHSILQSLTGNPTAVLGRVSPLAGQDGFAFGFPISFN